MMESTDIFVRTMAEDVYLFADRDEAGRKLASRLLHEPLVQDANVDQLLLLSIPTGGVIIGSAVARALGCAHDIIAVRKIRSRGPEPRTIGAVAEHGMTFLNKKVLAHCRHTGKSTGQAIEEAKHRVNTYIRTFRSGHGLNLHSKVVILVDEGISTGETMKAAVKWITTRSEDQLPEQLIVAVPICSPQVSKQIEPQVDKLICLSIPTELWAVGQYYWDFNKISDEKALEYLSRDTDIPAPAMPFEMI